MPIEITLAEPRMGFAGNHAYREGDKVDFILKGFLSSEDGDDLVTRLENFWNVIFSLLPQSAQPMPSLIDNALIIIKKDGGATLFINELQMITTIHPKRDLKKGEPVSEDDVADIERLSFQGVPIPPDAGYALLFSYQWRQGFAFDFMPLHGDDRTADVEVLLGRYLAYLQFQHLFKIKEPEWEALLNQKWFPFISLKSQTLKAMTQYLRAGWAVDGLLDRISADVASRADIMVGHWKSNALFAPHIDVFERAIERFLATDYISANSILYSRTEGLMRTTYQQATPGMSATAQVKSPQLIKAVIGDPSTSNRYMLLPERFNQYLKDIYFAGFNPSDPAPGDISRNTVAHGVADAAMLDQKAATIGLLVLEQLSFYLKS